MVSDGSDPRTTSRSAHGPLGSDGTLLRHIELTHRKPSSVPGVQGHGSAPPICNWGAKPLDLPKGKPCSQRQSQAGVTADGRAPLGEVPKRV